MRGCLPLFAQSVAAGFPSPADDYLEQSLDLNEYLIPHPAATFLVRAQGHSMTGAGIFDADILLVDRALEPRQGDVVLAALQGEFVCKWLDKKNQRLLSAHPQYPPLAIPQEAFSVEGVVVYSIRHHRAR